MTTARSVISNALSFGLNRLSPGETLDADLAAVCLSALNDIADEWNGSKSFLFREILSASTPITGTSAQLGVAWSSLVSGDVILGATVQYASGQDVAMEPLTMAQYQSIVDRSIASLPQYYAHDGAATVYIYPAATSHVITLLTQQAISDFADLDTDYVMPKGYKSALSACLAERMAPVLLSGIPPTVASAAKGARLRIMSQAANPAILQGSRVRPNIITGDA